MVRQNARQGSKNIIVMNIYNILTEDFEKWLVALGYADSTVYASTNYVRDFFDWLRSTPIKDINQINNQVISTYHEYLQKRKNKRMPGSLSNNYIISNINALKRFSKYLQESGRGSLEIDLQLRAIPAQTKVILIVIAIHTYFFYHNDIVPIILIKFRLIFFNSFFVSIL